MKTFFSFTSICFSGGSCRWTGCTSAVSVLCGDHCLTGDATGWRTTETRVHITNQVSDQFCILGYVLWNLTPNCTAFRGRNNIIKLHYVWIQASHTPSKPYLQYNSWSFLCHRLSFRQNILKVPQNDLLPRRTNNFGNLHAHNASKLISQNIFRKK